jgi:hypothetical protein
VGFLTGRMVEIFVAERLGHHFNYLDPVWCLVHLNQSEIIVFVEKCLEISPSEPVVVLVANAYLSQVLCGVMHSFVLVEGAPPILDYLSNAHINCRELLLKFIDNAVVFSFSTD